MSDDLIRRSDAIKVIDRMKHRLIGNGCTYEFMRQMIEELPIIKPKRGEWIDFKNGWKCNACEKWNSEKSNFCPNCGVDMREREGE